MSHGFEARFSQCFHQDLPSPLPRQVTNFVYPSTKLSEEGLVSEAASCRTHGLGGTQDSSPLLQFASNIIPIMTGFALSSRTSTATFRSFGTFQGSSKLGSFAPSSVGLSVTDSSPISRENQSDKKLLRRRKSKAKIFKVKEGNCTKSVMSVGVQHRECVISTQWMPDGQETDEPTGKVNNTRPMQCKQTQIDKKEQKCKRIQEKSFDMNNVPSVKVKTGGRHGEELAGWEMIAAPAEISSSDNEEHVYEDAEVYIDDNDDIEICRQISPQIQLKERMQKHVICIPERPHKTGTISLQRNIKFGTETNEVQSKRKVPPQKPPRRSKHDPQQGVQVVTLGDGIMDECEQNFSRDSCGQATSNFSIKNTDKIEKYYFGEVLKMSCKQRASSFSPPRHREMLSNPSREVLSRRNSRSHSPSMRFKKEEMKEKLSTQSRNINITLIPRPLFKMSLKTPLGNFKVTGGGRGCCCSSKHNSSGCSRSRQRVRRSSSSSPTTVNRRVPSSSRTRRRRKSLSPTPQNHQSHPVSHCILDRDQRSVDYQGGLKWKGDVEVTNLHPGNAFSIDTHYYDTPDRGNFCLKDN
nr:uncharacterized protein LOC123772440 [Procambarus clarkii]